MVTTPALSRVFTSTPDSCETGAVAMAVVPMANRMVPSSCFNLISLSPHAVVGSPPDVHGIPELFITPFRFRQRYFPRFGPTALANSNYLVRNPGLPALRRRPRIYLLYNLTRAFTTYRILHKLAENHRICGDLFHASVEHLILFPQRVSFLGAGDNHRHHFAADVFHRPGQNQLRNRKATFASGAIRPWPSGAGQADRADKRIPPSERSDAGLRDYRGSRRWSRRRRRSLDGGLGCDFGRLGGSGLRLAYRLCLCSLLGCSALL